jgi:translation initiation factor IF-2
MLNTKNNLIPRPPVIVVMGHVDHGKTSLLDCIRQAKVAAREAGGITQHLGAYEVEHQGRRITFLDTPGHEAFAAIRQRGSRVADIALLVIAADEGLKPQTLEAISYIKNEKLPFIAVLNKIDRPGANPEKVKQALAGQEVYVEEWGGSVPCVLTCATTGQGVDELLEMILLVADMEELSCDSNAEPSGVVLESTIDMRRGITSTVLILDGALRVGDTIYTSGARVKIKFLENFLGKRIDRAAAAMPCIITGWDNQPMVGDQFSSQIPQSQNQIPAKTQPLTPANQKKPEPKHILLLKADVSGSLEALRLMSEQLLKDLNLPYEFAGESVGEIVLADLKLAENTNATIIAFNSKLTAEAKGYYKPERITLLQGEIIYHLIEDLKKTLEQTSGQNQETILARMDIIALFSEPNKKNRQIVGGPLTEGALKPELKCSIVRNGEKIGSGKLLSIKKNKQELDSCQAPGEYGVQIEIKEPGIVIEKGDLIEFKK